MHLRDHASDLRRVVEYNCLVHLSNAERSNGVLLFLGTPNNASDLSNFELLALLLCHSLCGWSFIPDSNPGILPDPSLSNATVATLTRTVATSITRSN